MMNLKLNYHASRKRWLIDDDDDDDDDQQSSITQRRRLRMSSESETVDYDNDEMDYPDWAEDHDSCDDERDDNFFYAFLCIFYPGTMTTHAESINSDLQHGLDRRLRHTQH